MRFAYSSVEDLKRVTDLTDAEVAESEFGTNTTDEFFDDLFRLTSFRTDPALSEMLVTQSLDIMVWLRGKGVKFVPNFGRQSAHGGRQAALLRAAAHRGVGRRGGPRAGARQGRARRGHRRVLFHARQAPAAGRRARRRRACEPRRAAGGLPRAKPSSWPAAGSRRIRRCARATSASAGSSPRCAAAASTRATGSRWRSTSVPRRTATGRDVMPPAGT